MKKKEVAGGLALLFGIFGTHRFYLGQRKLGILYLVAFFFTMMITVEGNVPAILLPALVAFLDSILLFAMPRQEFDEKYNYRELGYERQPRKRRRHRRRAVPAPIAPAQSVAYLKREGIKAFRTKRYETATQFFEQVLEYHPDDPIMHFNLACCHSLLMDAEPAFYHLEKAVALGFDDLDKVYEHWALAWLHSLDEMDDFVKAGFKRPSKPGESRTGEADSLELAEVNIEQLDLLDKIQELGRLREEGILTEDEFEAQKQKWLLQ